MENKTHKRSNNYLLHNLTTLVPAIFLIVVKQDPQASHTQHKCYLFRKKILNGWKQLASKPSVLHRVRDLLCQCPRTLVETGPRVQKTFARAAVAGLVLLGIACGNDPSEGRVSGPANSPALPQLSLTLQITPQLMQQINPRRDAVINVTIKPKQSNNTFKSIAISLPTPVNQSVQIDFGRLPRDDYKILAKLRDGENYLLGWHEDLLTKDDIPGQGPVLNLEPIIQMTMGSNGSMLTWRDMISMNDYLGSHLANTVQACRRSITGTNITIHELQDGINYLLILYGKVRANDMSVAYRALGKIMHGPDGTRNLTALDLDETDNPLLQAGLDQANYNCGNVPIQGGPSPIQGDPSPILGDPGAYDPFQRDADNDTIGDNFDNCLNVKNPDQADNYGTYLGDACEDSDGDGILDLNDNCPTIANPDQANLDNATDDLGDACDPDIDGDGHNNTMDAFDRDPTEWDDTDNDTIGDNADNCPNTKNADQTNRYGNLSIGDACEDSDGDGILDLNDNCPLSANPNQANLDNASGDPLGDACDPDIDGDGHNNTMDAFDRDPTEWDDTDNDTIGDNADNCPNTKNADQINRYGNLSIGDACEDSDGDGILDINDNCPTQRESEIKPI